MTSPGVDALRRLRAEKEARRIVSDDGDAMGMMKTFRLTGSTYGKLQQLADRDKMNVSEKIRDLIERAEL